MITYIIKPCFLLFCLLIVETLILLQVELTTLKTNNARLTSALQESTANVDEWKRQLQLYKEENARVKAKYADLEAGKIAEGNSEALRLRVEALESELRTRNEEIKALTMATKNKDFVVCICCKLLFYMMIVNKIN